MSDNHRTREEQFLIVAPIGRDADLISSHLARAGMGSCCATSDVEAGALAESGVAGVIITAEALTTSGLQAWERLVRMQPPWSDLPFLVLGGVGSERHGSAGIEIVRRALGNVTFLDRPLRVQWLLSAAASALRARKRQYEMRDALVAQRETERALRQAEKLALAGRLAATISHEINNPLSAITNLVYLAEAKTQEQETRQHLADAQDELRRVSEIVEETLRFHRASGTPAEVQIAELLDSGIALFRHRIERRNVELVQRYEGQLVAYCSPGEVRQALVNLLANAIDALPAGGKLTVSAKPLSLRSRPGVMLFVADTGLGIPENARDQLFEQFFTTKGSSGTGLGLWLTREIVERNQGRLRFRSRVTSPSGTIFSIWLPSTPTAPSAAAPLPSEVKDAA